MADPVSPLAIAAKSAGVSIKEIAALLDIGLPWAWDLWTDKEDDEIHTLTLGKLQALATRLQVQVTALVYEFPDRRRRRASFDKLGLDASIFCDSQKLSVTEFSDLVGWEMQAFFDRTESAWDDWNLECLKDVCGMLGLNWPDYFLGPDNKSADSQMGEEDMADWANQQFESNAAAENAA